MAKGWRNESRRHSLAARGVKTAVDHKPFVSNKFIPHKSNEDLWELYNNNRYFVYEGDTLRAAGSNYKSIEKYVKDGRTVLNRPKNLQKNEFFVVPKGWVYKGKSIDSFSNGDYYFFETKKRSNVYKGQPQHEVSVQRHPLNKNYWTVNHGQAPISMPEFDSIASASNEAKRFMRLMT